MKKYLTIVTVLVLTMSLMAGCGKKEPAATTTTPSTAMPTTRPTTAPTTRPTTMPTTAPTTVPGTHPTETTDSGMEELLPGSEDTVDPSSGANQATGQRGRRMPGY